MSSDLVDGDMKFFTDISLLFSTGDGQKMVLDIGGRGIDLEKVQVHPTGTSFVSSSSSNH